MCLVTNVYSTAHTTSIQVSNGEQLQLEDQEPQMCRLSALHLFRRDYMAGNSQKRQDWFSKGAWEEVRAAFQALQPERREIYERERLNHVEKEKNLRPSSRKQSAQPLLLLQGRQNKSEEIVSDETELHSGQEPPISGINISAPILANLLPADFDELKHATLSLSNMSKASRSYATEQNKSNDATAWPVGESNVLAVLATTTAKRISLKQAGSEFSKKCQVVSGPEPGKDVFPERVIIHGQCGRLCQLDYSTIERLMHSKVVEALSAAASFDKPTKVVQGDVLVACHIECGLGKLVWYFFITSVSQKGGYNKSEAVHVLCDVVHRRDHADDFAARCSFQLRVSFTPPSGAIRVCASILLHYEHKK